MLLLVKSAIAMSINNIFQVTTAIVAVAGYLALYSLRLLVAAALSTSNSNANFSYKAK